MGEVQTKLVELGDKLQLVKELTGVEKDLKSRLSRRRGLLGNEGFKIAPHKCELLNNFIITDVVGHIIYNSDAICNVLNDETDKLEDWMIQPDTDYGYSYTFIGELYGKNVVINVVGPDHSSCYSDTLGPEWLNALNIIIEAFYGDNINNSEDKLAVLSEVSGAGLGLNALTYAEVCADDGLDQGVQTLGLNFDTITIDEAIEFIKSVRKGATIKEFIDNSNCTEDDAVIITITRDKVVYHPYIRELDYNGCILDDVIDCGHTLDYKLVIKIVNMINAIFICRLEGLADDIASIEERCGDATELINRFNTLKKEMIDKLSLSQKDLEYINNL